VASLGKQNKGDNDMLQYLIRSQNDAIKVLAASCFTKQNYASDYVNDTISNITPNGVLGGSVAALSADYMVVAGNGVNTPIGLFVNDAAGIAWENNQARASNKLTIAKGLPSVEVDVYETHDIYGSEITYVIGDKLYCSANGFLTNEESAEGTFIGILTKVPVLPGSPAMGVDLRI